MDYYLHIIQLLLVVQKVLFDLQAKQPSQFTVYINNLPIESTITGNGSGSGQVSLRQLLKLNKDDELSIKNHSSFLNPVITNMNPGGRQAGVNTIFYVQKIANIPKKKYCCPPPKK